MDTVDTHIRERLSALRQQQEDVAVLLSHVTAACHRCEVTLKQVRGCVYCLHIQVTRDICIRLFLFRMTQKF